MNVFLTAKLTDLAGEPLKANDKELTLKDVIIGSLVGVLDEDRSGQTLEKVTNRWFLTMKIHNANGAVDLTPEELSTIRSRIAKHYTLVPAGRALDLLK